MKNDRYCLLFLEQLANRRTKPVIDIRCIVKRQIRITVEEERQLIAKMVRAGWIHHTKSRRGIAWVYLERPGQSALKRLKERCG